MDSSNICGNLNYYITMLKLFSLRAYFAPASSPTASTHLHLLSARLQLPLRPPLLLDDTTTRRLTRQEKLQLGLYLPPSPFNPRLTRSKEQQYLCQLTSELYQQQLAGREWGQGESVRILQQEQTAQTLDGYVNAVYKDVYARFLMAKGVRVEWEGGFARAGALNPAVRAPVSQQEKVEVVRWLMQSQSAALVEEAGLGLFSAARGQFTDVERVEVEKTRGLGHYVRLRLTDFGCHREQFQGVVEQGSSVWLMVFVDQLVKLADPQSICLQPQDRLVMLKTYPAGLAPEYLITALATFQNHQKYFSDLGYERHSNFDARHLEGMAANGLPLLPELPHYRRPPNLYLASPHHSLPDFERLRATSPSLPIPPSRLTPAATLSVAGQLLRLDEVGVGRKLREALEGEGVEFMDCHDVFEDEIYYDSESKEVLRFRVGSRWVVRLPPDHSQLVTSSLQRQKTLISQSKVTIPPLPPGRKPKERRQLRKHRKQQLAQITEHLSLSEALQEITSISVSSLSPTPLSMEIYVRNGRVVSQSEGSLQKIYLNEQFLRALLFLRRLETDRIPHNVIIEPQSAAESLLAPALHLHALHPARPPLRLIKLHPTLHPQHRSTALASLLDGLPKANNHLQHGFGREGLRLWVASQDQLKGDRLLSEADANAQLQRSQSLRKLYWELKGLIPKGAPPLPAGPLGYLSRFMLDLASSYCLAMEESYRVLDLHQAHQLTFQFFEEVVGEVFVKTVRRRLTAYPNAPDTAELLAVAGHLAELAAVWSPLLPFSAHHVLQRLPHWPAPRPHFHTHLPLHNEMLRLRVQLRNKLRLNRMAHAQLLRPNLKEALSDRDLELFFDLEGVVGRRPQLAERGCSVRLPRNSRFASDFKLQLFVSDDHCLRCDPQSTTQHLCSRCVSYLQINTAQPLLHFPTHHSQLV